MEPLVRAGRSPDGCLRHGVLKQLGADESFPKRLARAQAGEPRAHDELVRWLERPLTGFLRARGAEDCEGLANDVLVRVFGSIKRFEGGPADFRAWVFRIARNALIDERRYLARRPGMTPTAHDDLPQSVTTDDPTDRISQRERVDALLAGLTDEQREVLLLRIVAGLSVEETAQTVRRRPGAVRALQHRALARLRISLADLSGSSGRP